MLQGFLSRLGSWMYSLIWNSQRKHGNLLILIISVTVSGPRRSEFRENHSSGLYVNSGQMRTIAIQGRWIPPLNSHSYLDLGSSPSSFLHRTVGTGSPRASHLNSALSSTVTAKLLGLFTKDGLSKIRKSISKKYRNLKPFWMLQKSRFII